MENIPCWLIPLIVGFICAILGYLLGRLFGKGEDPSNDLDLWKRKNASLKADLEACRSELKIIAVAVPVVASSSASMSSSFANKATDTPPSTIAVAPFDASVAKTAFGKTIKEDDLTIVEGIGPKISELFHNFDIKTWAALADTSLEKCQEVLTSGGKRFEIHRPKNWPLQAKLAAEGKWDELKKWQDEHEYGKE